MGSSIIKMVRIDDRLIHGQVMTAWLKYARINNVLIIDDETANDTFIKNMIEIVVPRPINIQVMTLHEGVSLLKSYNGGPLFLLVKSPRTIEVLVNEQIQIEKVIVGGMASCQNRKKLFKGVSASYEEVESFKKLISFGIEIVVQIVPDEKSIQIQDLF